MVAAFTLLSIIVSAVVGIFAGSFAALEAVWNSVEPLAMLLLGYYFAPKGAGRT